MSLRLYTPHLEFYDGYIRMLADEARDGFEPALQRMANCVPRFSGQSPDDPGIEDARLVYAVEHGFDS